MTDDEHMKRGDTKTEQQRYERASVAEIGSWTQAFERNYTGERLFVNIDFMMLICQPKLTIDVAPSFAAKMLTGAYFITIARLTLTSWPESAEARCRVCVPCVTEMWSVSPAMSWIQVII